MIPKPRLEFTSISSKIFAMLARSVGKSNDRKAERSQLITLTFYGNYADSDMQLVCQAGSLDLSREWFAIEESLIFKKLLKRIQVNSFDEKFGAGECEKGRKTLGSGQASSCAKGRDKNIWRGHRGKACKGTSQEVFVNTTITLEKEPGFIYILCLKHHSLLKSNN